MESFAMDESLDRWITGNYGEDQYNGEDGEQYDPREDEPDLDAWRERNEE